jgi:hypothetical protein
MLMALLVSSCTLTAPRQGGVRVASNVPDAVLYVDEEVQGPVRAYEEQYIYLDPGEHRLMLEHPEHFTEFAEVEVQSNTGMHVRFEMRRRPE